MIFRWAALVAAWLLVVGAVVAAPNGTVDAVTTTAAPVTSDVAPTSATHTEKASEEDERPANVEQVPPPAPLITESAHKGYRMPGLYGMGSQPFYLELDPETGAVDFSNPTHPQTDNNHRYSSKVSQPVAPSHDQEYDYEEVAVHEESDPIDRKDTLGPNRPNDIKPYQQDFTPYYQSNSYKEKIPAKEKFPLISSSYANTKVQGTGIVKQEPQKPITISTPPPSYFTFKPSTHTTTTESILDFWPQKSSTAAPKPQENYDYYEESPVEEEVLEEEMEDEVMTSTTTTTKPPSASTSQSIVYSKPFIPTPLPTLAVPTTMQPKPTTQRPTSFSQPYGFEEPFRPIYGPGEGEEEPLNKPDLYKPVDGRPLPPSIYNLPPKADLPPPNIPQRPPPSQRPDLFIQANVENRPTQSVNFKNPPTENRPSIFSPPPVPIYNQQPGPQKNSPYPPSPFPQPPQFEATRFQEEGNQDDNDEQTPPPTIRAPQIDSQGWKQATFTQTSPPAPSTTTRVQFPDEQTDETYTPGPRPSSPSTFRQPLPQGYEPQRPPPPQLRPPLVRPRPTLELQAGLRPPNEGQIRPNFEGPRPQFERPNMDVPIRHQFDGRPPLDGPIRPPPPNDGLIRPPFDGPLMRPPQQQQPPLRRWETRPPGPLYAPISSPPGPGNKYNGMRIKNNQDGPLNKPNQQQDLPNILPQFRPNARISFQVENKPSHRPIAPPAVRRPPGPYLDRFYAPPPPSPVNIHQNAEDRYSSPPPQRFQNTPPLVGRRVGSQVSTLQMMQHGVLPRPSSREDAPHPNPRPPVTPYEVRPSKYGSLQQGSEERPVFVVYANSGENQQAAGDVLIGTHGPQKPLPPSHLTEEEQPILNKKPQIPVKTDFPYALEKPAEEINKITSNEEVVDKDEEINIIPNLQDYMPFAIKSTTTKSQQSTFASSPSSSTTSVYKISPEIMTTEVKPTIQSIIRPQSNNNEFTVSAVMHTGSHPSGQGTGSVMVVAPQHRHPATSQTASASPLSPESFNFQAPFHASANVAPSPGNGWSAVKGSTAVEETLRPGLVDRADIADESNAPPSTGTSNSKFDIENFKPELIGGFKPLYSFPEESSGKPSEKQQTTEREEKNI